jgi:hypothetical protein
MIGAFLAPQRGIRLRMEVVYSKQGYDYKQTRIRTVDKQHILMPVLTGISITRFVQLHLAHKLLSCQC